jgi:GAF domain-containing protein
LYEISARLNAATTIQEALEAAAGPAIVNGANSAMLLRLHTNAEGEPFELEPIAAWPRNTDVPMPLGVRMALSEVTGAEHWLSNPHEPLLLNNLANAVDLDAAPRARWTASGVNAVAFLPLKLGVRWVGLLTFQWTEAHSFSPNEFRLYRAIMAQAATVLDNRALFEQTQVALEQTQNALAQVQQAQARLNLQYQTANILARAESFAQAAPSLLEMTCRAFDWQIGEFWTFDAARNYLVHFSAWTPQDGALRDFENEARSIQFTPGQGLVGRAWEAKQPIWISDVRTDPGFQQSSAAQQAGLVTALAFPVQSEARQFGVSVFFSTRRQELDDALMATMGSLGSQIGQFLERLRAEEAVRQQNTFLTALHDMALGLMHRLDLEELLQNIITRAAELVGTEHGYVHLVEANGTELRMRIGIGLYQDFVGTRVKPGQGLAGTVWQTAKPIVVDDYRHWAGRLPMVDRDVLRAVVGVPLKSGEQTVGVLGLASLDDGRVFSPAQVEAVERFAELAAVALDNARLYDVTQQALLQTRRLAEREKASAEIADRLYAAPDIKTVLQTAASELRRATGSKRAVVRLYLGNNGESNANDSE